MSDSNKIDLCRFIEYGSVHATWGENAIQIPLDDFKNFDAEAERVAETVRELLSRAIIDDSRFKDLKLKLVRHIGIAEEKQDPRNQIVLQAFSLRSLSKADNCLLASKANNFIKCLTFQILPCDLLHDDDRSRFQLGDNEIKLTEVIADDFIKKKGGCKIRKPFEISVGNDSIDIAGRFSGNSSKEPLSPIKKVIMARVNRLEVDQREIEVKENEEQKSTGTIIKFQPNSFFLQILKAIETQHDYRISYHEKQNSSGGHFIRELFAIEGEGTLRMDCDLG